MADSLIANVLYRGQISVVADDVVRTLQEECGVTSCIALRIPGRGRKRHRQCGEYQSRGYRSMKIRKNGTLGNVAVSVASIFVLIITIFIMIFAFPSEVKFFEDHNLMPYYVLHQGESDGPVGDFRRLPTIFIVSIINMVLVAAPFLFLNIMTRWSLLIIFLANAMIFAFLWS